VSGRLGVTLAGGGALVGGATGARWRLTGVGRIGCSGPRFLMRFSPTALGRRGEATLLTLGRRWATMAAGVGRAAKRKLGVNGGRLRGSSGKLRAPACAVVLSDPFGMVNSTWAVAHQRGGRLHMAARVLTIADQNSPQNGHYI
jgi:hypothetical protein